jgi:hypothetical protein
LPWKRRTSPPPSTRARTARTHSRRRGCHSPKACPGRSPALDALGELAAQADIFDRRAVHPWRGLAVEPGEPPRRDALEADILDLRDVLDVLASHLPAVALLWESRSASLSIAALQSLARALREVATLDRLPERWASREITELLWTAGLLAAAAARAGELAAARSEHTAALTVAPEQAILLLEESPPPVVTPARRARWVPSERRWRSDADSNPSASSSLRYPCRAPSA